MSKFEAYKSSTSASRVQKRNLSAEDTNQPEQKRQAVQRTLFSGVKVPAQKIDDLVLDYVVQEMRPISTVEKPAFKNLVIGLNPEAHIMSRKTLATRLNVKYTSMKLSIKDELNRVKFVCTTADIWSSHKRSYFGATAHWITDDLQRRSCAVVYRRFTGTHSYNRIAEILQDTFAEYGLHHEKILATVTDNGSNVVKAFKEYSVPLSDELIGDTYKIDNDLEIEDNGDDDEEIVLTDVCSLLSAEDDDTGIILPPHQRCVCHTLNLVASRDAAEALKDSLVYKRLHNAAMAKCSALWNASSRPKAAEVIQSICGKQLLQPCATRWNSTYDSINRLTELKTHLNQVCTALNIAAPKDVELDFLGEFLLVMKPLAVAVDKMQGEKECFLAFLLPSLHSNLWHLLVEKSLVEVLAKIKHAQPLARAVLKGLQTRFGGELHMVANVDHYILAAVTHPFFKLRWVPESQKDRVRKLLLDTSPQMCHI